MDPLFYKLLHILGVLAAFVSLGGLTFQALAGGTGDRGRKVVSITHGVALLIILVSGFGLLAKLKLGFPLWFWLKVAIWLVVGGLVVAIRRLPRYATVFWFGLPILGGLAAYLALYKPG